MYFLFAVLAVFAVFAVSVAPLTAASTSLDDAPNWRAYCAEIGTLSDQRRIPSLKPKVKSRNPKLTHVQMFSRHGARTPTKRHDGCWKDYNPIWNCEETEAVISLLDPLQVTSSLNQTSPNGQSVLSVLGGRPKQSSYLFQRRYDADTSASVFQGSCKAGQLIEYGAEQLNIVGEVVADAYFNTNETAKVVENPLLNFTDPNNNLKNFQSIYFRSTEYQRTVASGSHMLTGMLKKIANAAQHINDSNETSLRDKFVADAAVGIPLHTLDSAVDYMYPQWSDPMVKQMTKDCDKSKEFQKLHESSLPFVRKLNDLLEVNLLENGIWSEQLFDSYMTSACPSSHLSDLPQALKNENIAQELYARSTRESMFYVTCNKNQVSRHTSRKMISEMRNDILRALCSNCTTQSEWNDLVSSYVTNTKHFLETATDQLTKRPVKRLAYWSGHDTTLMPLMAALGVFDGAWPNYASLLTFEVYTTDDASNFAFRIVYNGEDITHRFPDCPNDDLCSISKFFVHSKWVEDPPLTMELYLQLSSPLVGQSFHIALLPAVSILALFGLVSVCVIRYLKKKYTRPEYGEWHQGLSYSVGLC